MIKIPHRFFTLVQTKTLLAILFLFASQASTAKPAFPQQKIVASDGATEDFFSFSVAIHKDTALIGAFKADSKNKERDTGAAYVYTRKANTSYDHFWCMTNN